MESKTCKECGVEKPLDGFHIKWKRWRSPICAECRGLWHKEHYAKNRTERLSYMKERNEKFPEIKKVWREKNRDHLREMNDLWREANWDYVLKESAIAYKSLKDRVYRAYGGYICRCCGE